MKNRILKPIIIGMMFVVMVFFKLHVDHMDFSASLMHNEKMMRSESLLSKELDLQIEKATNNQVINYDTLNSAIKQYELFIDVIKNDPDREPFFLDILQMAEKKLEAIDDFKRANSLQHNSIRYMDNHIRQTFIVKGVKFFSSEQRLEINRLLEAIHVFGYGEHNMAEEIVLRAKVLDTFPDIAKIQQAKQLFKKHLALLLAEGEKLEQALENIRTLNKSSSAIIAQGTLSLEQNEFSVDQKFSTIIKTTLFFSLILLIIFYFLIDRLLKQEREIKEEIDRATADLRKKNHLLEKYQNTVDKHVIISRSDTNGVITYASRAFCEISGYSKEELLGKGQNIVRHPDMPTELYRELWNTISRKKIWQGEMKNRKKDGTPYWVDVTITPDLDQDGHIVGYSAIRHDITAKKALEKLTATLEQQIYTEVMKNREKTAQMIQQSRLAQMGEMMSMIAHQWRQPLASISAITSTLQLDVVMENYKKAFFEERLEAISELSQHLSFTIDDFREFFKEAKIKTASSCTEMVEGSLGIIEPTLVNKNITVHKEFATDYKLLTYPNEIKQVLLNILKNAEDVLLEKCVEEPAIWITTRCIDDAYAHITIEDNGGGIPEEILSKLFDPYFSTKNKKDGTGLGLYMSKTIIEEHCKGILNVVNTEKGARFEITLPKEEEQHE